MAQPKNLPVIVKNSNDSFKGLPKKATSLTGLTSKLENVKVNYQCKGFLAFSVDSIVTDSAFNLYLFKGPRYKISEITCSPAEFETLLPKHRKQTYYNPFWVATVEQRLLNRLNSQGYLFATIEKKITVSNHQVDIHFDIKINQKIYFDSLKIKGDTEIDPRFLLHKTGIMYLKSYEPDKINKIKSVVNETGFLQFDSLTTEITDSLARINLFIHPQKNNQLNGLIGMQTNSDNKLEFTGKADLQLTNTFKKGEYFSLAWKQPAKSSQDLDIETRVPFIMQLPVGISGKFSYEKMDSTYSNTTLKPGVSIGFYNKGTLSLLYEWNNSAVSQSYLDTYTPSESHLYGFNFQVQNFNHPVIPSKGYLIEVEVLMGNQINQKGTTLEQETFLSEFQIKNHLIYSLPIGAIALKNETRLLFNDSLPLNLFYRTGGFASFEGVTEKSIICRHLSYFTTAYQLNFNKTSQVQFFYQLGWFNEMETVGTKTVRRQSVGLSLNLETKAGRLYLSFALGKKGAEPFRIDQGKLHLGYANSF